MPQFDISTFMPQIFWLLVCFGALLFFSTSIGLPKLEAVFNERWQHIEGSMEESARLQAQAQILMTNFESHLAKVKKDAHDSILGAARQGAMDISRQKVVLAQEHKKKFRDNAFLIVSRKASTMGDVQEIASSVIAPLMSQLLSRKIDEVPAHAMVADLIEAENERASHAI